jgi:hypothetical protein
LGLSVTLVPPKGKAFGRVWLVEPVVPLTTQPGQVVALGLVGSAAELVATVSQYRSAPLTVLQLKVGVVETPVDALLGALSVGAGSKLLAVVKLNMLEKLPCVPLVFQP